MTLGVSHRECAQRSCKPDNRGWCAHWAGESISLFSQLCHISQLCPLAVPAGFGVFCNNKFSFLHMKRGAHMDIKHTSDDTAWVCLRWASTSRSLRKGESQALSAPARKSLADLSAVAANLMHAPSRAARSWPVGQVAAHGDFLSCPSEGTSRARRSKSRWCGSVCV